MSIRNEIVEALEFLEGENLDAAGEQMVLITPSDAEIPCVPSMEDVGSEVAIGPNIEKITAVVRVRKSHFVTADNTVITVDSDIILADNSTGRPRSGTGAYRTGGFRGKTYRVLLVSEDPTGAYFKITLGSGK